MTYLYLIKSRNHYFHYKIGITTNLRKRRSQIEKTARIRTALIFAVPLIGAYFAEQVLHKIYHVFRVRKFRGSGKTEWFYFLLPISPIFLMLCAFVGQVGMFLIIIYSLLNLFYL